MQGVSINDLNGRRILSTHFAHPLRAALAIDAALACSDPIAWVPSLEGDYTATEDSSDEEEEDQQETAQPWAQTSRRAGGQAVCQVERNGLRFVAPVAADVDPVLPLAFLNQLHEVLESYIGGPVTEASLKDNFDIVLALLEEMMASGRPLLSEAAQLRELVVPPSQLLAKVALGAANVAGLSVATQSTANALLSSPLPWRRQGIKYNSNEIYFDLTEHLSYILDSRSKITTASIAGDVACRSRLSGMPDLTLSFTDASQLEDCAFHSSVRYARWGKERVVSFVPPDGAFSLMRFSLSGLSPSPSTTSTARSTSLASTLLPLSITHTLTHGSQGSSFHLTLTSRAPSSRPLQNIRLRLPLGKGVSGVTAALSGGAYAKEGQSAGAGRWEVKDGGEGLVLEWWIEELVSTDRPAVLSGQYYTSPHTKPPPSFQVTFDSPSSAFSGLRISALKVAGEGYSIYKGVRLRGKGEIEVRC
ncbi:Mu homology domain-containing protein [Leucosporidium creatinivorum]|uniref:Mu homology domain-containing protein n=1 Tax=Leucosporidium creatinivorum TaxID=106004 RepID=A0A1Y2G0E2_9BASI|nr:Mu homology domain-containing protein [Leucosporidium creatinivorum]